MKSDAMLRLSADVAARLGVRERGANRLGRLTGEMEALDDDRRERALGVERLDDRVADDEQRDDGDEQVPPDHERELFAFDLLEAAVGSDREAGERTILERPDLIRHLPNGALCALLAASQRFLHVATSQTQWADSGQEG